VGLRKLSGSCELFLHEKKKLKLTMLCLWGLSAVDRGQKQSHEAI
jgi:hypothetical protein